LGHLGKEQTDTRNAIVIEMINSSTWRPHVNHLDPGALLCARQRELLHQLSKEHGRDWSSRETERLHLALTEVSEQLAALFETFSSSLHLARR
jgi:hypothetical protein